MSLCTAVLLCIGPNLCGLSDAHGYKVYVPHDRMYDPGAAFKLDGKAEQADGGVSQMFACLASVAGALLHVSA